MAGTIDLENLLWALGILLLPLLLAIPARILYQTLFLGIGPAERSYRAMVQRILDAGMQVEHFRDALSNESRKLGIKPGKARLNETDLLYPLGLAHFLLTPMVLILPVLAVAALPIVILGAPVLWALEIILIRQRLLINIIKRLETWFGKQIIHIPDSGHGHVSESSTILETSNMAVHFYKVPRVVFLGLFAWLIIHWMFRLETGFIEIILASVLYIFMLGVIGIITTALESDLVLVDPSKGRIMPISDWLDSMLNPIVGVGLLFLLGRDLMFEARDGNAVLFALTVLIILYCATAVGITFQWGYAWWRGKQIRVQFEAQAVEKLNPFSYDLTRNRGRIQLNVRCTMAERLADQIGPKRELSFTDLDNLPSAHSGVITSPSNPLKK